MSWSRRDWWLLVAITVIGIGLRFYQLGIVPPGFQFDEAFNAIDAQLVLAGNRSLFLPANAGREVLYTYWQAFLAGLFGLNVYTLRLASALLGVAALPVTYLLVRRLLAEHSHTVATATALVLAISIWHVHFSRYGIRVISMPVVFSAAFGLAWLGVHAATRRVRLWANVGCGLFTGLSVWTHPTGRLAPIVLIGFVLWILWRYPERRRFRLDSPLGGLLITGAVSFLVFLPLGIEFYRHPEFFFGHASEVSVFAERVGGDSPLRTLASNLLHVLGMFSFTGDREWTHGLAGRPVFDWPLALAFYGGLVLYGLRLRRRDRDADALALFAIWAAIMLFPSILSEAAPNYSRTLPALPALFVPAGLGLAWLWEQRRPVAWAGPAAAALIALYSAGQMSYDYFVRFAQRPEVYYMYDGDKLDALTYLSQYTGANQVYLSQLWGDLHSTVYFLRSTLGIKSVDTSDTLVLPPAGQGAVYAFPAEQAERAEELARLWPNVTPEPVFDPHGRQLLSVVKLDAATAAGWPPAASPTLTRTAAFVDAPHLMGMRADPPGDRISLYWEAMSPMVVSLTSFVHLLDRDGQRVAQVDKLPGNGSYRTFGWTPGERVIDRATPVRLDRCAGGETVRVQVGWYQLSPGGSPLGAPRPRADSTGYTALAGEVVLPHVTYQRPYLQPRIHADAAILPTLTLIGYDLHDDAFQAGSPLVIDVYWHSVHPTGDDGPGDLPVALVLDDGSASVALWSGPLAQGLDWDADTSLCRRIRTSLPIDLASGDHPLAVAWTLPSGPQSAGLGHVAVEPSTRRYALPPLLLTADAQLVEPTGAQLRLAGVSRLELDPQPDLATGAPVLLVELAWQAQDAIAGNYKVFVHLLDESGSIVAQSDAVPADGYATSRWLPQEVVIDLHRIKLPAGLQPGIYHLVAGLYDPVENQRLAARDAADAALIADQVPLGNWTYP
jgi:4-amino-4-deoxy-L-arabinose transferase-like glycosyltransferase